MNAAWSLAAAHLRRAHETRIGRARVQVCAIARALAEDGLSAETIREALTDIATDAGDRAAKYIAEYEAEQEARAVEDDKSDPEDERDARAAKEDA